MGINPNYNNIPSEMIHTLLAAFGVAGKPVAYAFDQWNRDCRTVSGDRYLQCNRTDDLVDRVEKLDAYFTACFIGSFPGLDNGPEEQRRACEQALDALKGLRSLGSAVENAADNYLKKNEKSPKPVDLDNPVIRAGIGDFISTGTGKIVAGVGGITAFGFLLPSLEITFLAGCFWIAGGLVLIGWGIVQLIKE